MVEGGKDYFFTTLLITTLLFVNLIRGCPKNVLML